MTDDAGVDVLRPQSHQAPSGSTSGATRRQGSAIAAAVALTLAGAAYSVSTLDSRQTLVRQASAAPAGTPSAAPPSAPASGSPSTTSPSATRSATSPAATTSAGSDGLLQPAAPWVRLSDTAATTGPVTLARAAEIDGHGALSRAGLLRLGFTAGRSRAWQAGGATLLVLDYTFRDTKGATGFVRYGQQARDSDAGYRRLTVTGIPGAVAYRTSDATSVTRVVLLSRGRSAYIVGVQGTPPTGAAGDVTALARSQYEAAAR